MSDKVREGIILALALSFVIGATIAVARFDDAQRQRIIEQATKFTKAKGCTILEKSWQYHNRFYIQCPTGIEVLDIGEM